MDSFPPPDERDFVNPYAPPQSAFVPETIAPLRAGIPFTANDVFNWSWAIFKERMGICLGILWGTYGINIGLSLGVNLLIQALVVAAKDRGALAVVAIIVIYCISVAINYWVLAGLFKAYLKIGRNQPVEFSEVFQGGRYVLTMIFAALVYGIVIAVLVALLVGVSMAGFSLLGNQSAGGIVFLVIGIVLTAVLALYVSARLGMCFFLIVDRDAGAIDSLQQSWELTRNKAGTVILIIFLAVAVYMGGFLAFCVGVLFTLPLAFMMFTVTYLALAGTPSVPQKKADLIWEDEL
jgi:hypothetical protein